MLLCLMLLCQMLLCQMRLGLVGLGLGRRWQQGSQLERRELGCGSVTRLLQIEHAFVDAEAHQRLGRGLKTIECGLLRQPSRERAGRKIASIDSVGDRQRLELEHRRL